MKLSWCGHGGLINTCTGSLFAGTQVPTNTLRKTLLSYDPVGLCLIVTKCRHATLSSVFSAEVQVHVCTALATWAHPMFSLTKLCPTFSSKEASFLAKLCHFLSPSLPLKGGEGQNGRGAKWQSFVEKNTSFSLRSKSNPPCLDTWTFSVIFSNIGKLDMKSLS